MHLQIEDYKILFKTFLIFLAGLCINDAIKPLITALGLSSAYHLFLPILIISVIGAICYSFNMIYILSKDSKNDHKV